jgi:exopolysaccharide biosynthesis polyprenyl glycosylphosphotransferase
VAVDYQRPVAVETERSRVERPAWETGYATLLVVVDALAVTIAAFVALRTRFAETPSAAVSGVSYQWITATFAPAWVLLMATGRAYEARFLGGGSEEYKRVFNAAIRFTAVVATFAYATKFELARGYVGIALPLATVLTLAFRHTARQLLYRGRRTKGDYCHRVLAVGNRQQVVELIKQVRREPKAGLTIVGACVTGRTDTLTVGGEVVPVLGGLPDVAAAVASLGVDTVAVAASPGVTADTLRRLSWEIEGTGVGLVVAPQLTDIAGPRIHIRPVAGLPLLYVEEPELTGARRILKGLFDRALALLLVVLLAPLLAGIALLIRSTSKGPAFFRQVRVGRGGDEFRVFKFRTMRVDAEQLLTDLESRNENADGLLFKIRDDPRVTKHGRWLRKYSLDELPQLFNVLRGEMSLVGPRPPLPTEVARYGDDVRRRLLVKPGITGLWQISGRSDLDWDETVRLDLYYVENWSIAFDFLILWRTFFAVLEGRGAY